MLSKCSQKTELKNGLVKTITVLITHQTSWQWDGKEPRTDVITNWNNFVIFML